MGKKTTAMINGIIAACRKKTAFADEYTDIETKLNTAETQRDKAFTAYQTYYKANYDRQNLDGREATMDADVKLQTLDKAFRDLHKKVDELTEKKTKARKDFDDQCKELEGLLDDLDRFVTAKGKARILPWDTSSMRKAKAIIKLVRGG
jgi:hypothetical protein